MLFIRHDRRRWYVLIVAATLYLCSHSYVLAVLATIAGDLALFFVGRVVFFPQPEDTPESIAADAAVHALTVAVGVTINAFSAYAFDLSFLYGLQWLYFAVTLFLYLYFKWLDAIVFDHRMYLDYFFGVAALAVLVFFMNFVAYGEPYTFLMQMLYIASVVALAATSESLRWYAALIFVCCWIVVISIGLIVNEAVDHEYRHSLRHYFGYKIK